MICLPFDIGAFLIPIHVINIVIMYQRLVRSIKQNGGNTARYSVRFTMFHNEVFPNCPRGPYAENITGIH